MWDAACEERLIARGLIVNKGSMLRVVACCTQDLDLTQQQKAARLHRSLSVGSDAAPSPVSAPDGAAEPAQAAGSKVWLRCRLCRIVGTCELFLDRVCVACIHRYQILLRYLTSY